MNSSIASLCLFVACPPWVIILQGYNITAMGVTDIYRDNTFLWCHCIYLVGKISIHITYIPIDVRYIYEYNVISIEKDKS